MLNLRLDKKIGTFIVLNFHCNELESAIIGQQFSNQGILSGLTYRMCPKSRMTAEEMKFGEVVAA